MSRRGQRIQKSQKVSATSARRVRFGAEGKLYFAVTVKGPNVKETWHATFSIGSAALEWDSEHETGVFQDASVHLDSVTRVVPKGERVRLSRALARQLRSRALKAIGAERESTELDALLALYTLR